MERLSRTRRALRRLGVFGLTALAGGGCDLQSKAWAEGTLRGRPGHSMMLADPWLELSLAYNRGTAFSLIPDLGTARLVFGLIALSLVVFLAVAVVRSQQGRFDALALGTIAGGAIGNGIDRMATLVPGGQPGVVDFVKINYPWGGSWPTFNVADVLILIGVAALILGRMHERKPESQAEGTAQPVASS